MGRISLKKAEQLARERHEGQFRVGGEPYVTHPIAVAQIVKDWGLGEDYQATALFHDLLEDTDATEDEILRIGGKRVLHSVKLLTKQKGYVMEQYVSAILSDPMARAVKAADRLHNLRCATVTDDTFKMRYIFESVDWYLDLCAEIPEAIRALASSLSAPSDRLEFLSRPVSEWRSK